jgi:hypothetical protein
MQCSICSGPVTEGHNAEPVNDGRCCTVCNDMVVIPSRIKRLKTIKDQPKWYGNPNPPEDGSGLKGKLPKGLLEPPDRGCKSTMTMSKWDIRSILELMVSMQRDAGVTIAGILDEAVSYTVGTYHSDETDGHEFAVSPRLGHCTWGCEESPVMLCVYDSYKDPAMDECLYCGLPDERK